MLIRCWLVFFISLSIPCVYSQETHIRVSGSETMNKMMTLLAESYHKLHPSIFIDVKGGHSEQGLQDLKDGKADICATTKPPITTIAEEFNSFYEDPLTKKTIATEALVIFVNKKNIVHQLTCDQLTDIFSGKITDWKQLGGKHGVIKPYRMPDLSGTAQTFQAVLMRGAKYAPTLEVKNSSSEMATAVDKDIHAIAYGKLVHLSPNMHALALQDCDNIDPKFYEPSSENVRSQKYFFTRQLFLMTTKKMKPEVKTFLEWVLTPEAQSIIAGVGFIPIK